MIGPVAKDNFSVWISQEKNLHRLSLIASLVFLVLLGRSMANLAWSFLPAPATSSIESLQSAPALQSVNRAAPDILISSLHLFGSAEEQAANAAQSISIEDAPVTKLELVLMGVLFSESKDEARAIIADRQQRIEQHYSIGQEIAPGAELVEIYREKVILRNRGQLETLFLDEQTPERSNNRIVVNKVQSSTSNLPQRTIDRTSRVDLSKTLGELRNQMLTDPSSMAQQLEATPVTEAGVFRGFRIAPGRDRSLLARFGLRTGDVVTNINGVEFDSPMKGLEVMSSLASASKFDITVLRRGQLITYSFGIE